MRLNDSKIFGTQKYEDVESKKRVFTTLQWRMFLAS